MLPFGVLANFNTWTLDFNMWIEGGTSLPWYSIYTMTWVILIQMWVVFHFEKHRMGDCRLSVRQWETRGCPVLCFLYIWKKQLIWNEAWYIVCLEKNTPLTIGRWTDFGDCFWVTLEEILLTVLLQVESCWTVSLTLRWGWDPATPSSESMLRSSAYLDSSSELFGNSSHRPVFTQEPVATVPKCRPSQNIISLHR